MPILTLQRQARELGRIRTGVQEEFVKRGGGKGLRPAKLETFRLSAANRDLIEAAREVYGGRVEPWNSPTGAQWQVVTESPSLDVIVPPGQVLDQWFEMWSGGGCLRRCNGVTMQNGLPCACPDDVAERLELAKDGHACKATTRLWVILWKLPDIGRWRLESHGYYAATELGGAALLLARATQEGQAIPATLRLDHRQRKAPGQPPKKFLVPVLEAANLYLGAMGLVDPTIGQLQQGQLTQLPAPRSMRQLGPGTPAMPETPLPKSSSFRAPHEVAAVTAASAPVEPVANTAAMGSRGTDEADGDSNPASAEVQVEPAVTAPAAGSQASPDETSGEPEPVLGRIVDGSASPEASLIDRLQRSESAWHRMTDPVPFEEWSTALREHFAEIPRSELALVIAAAFDLEPERNQEQRIVGWPFERRHVMAIDEVAKQSRDAFRPMWRATAAELAQ